MLCPAGITRLLRLSEVVLLAVADLHDCIITGGRIALGEGHHADAVGLQRLQHHIDGRLVQLAVDQEEAQGLLAEGTLDGRTPLGVAIGRVGGLRQQLRACY